MASDVVTIPEEHGIETHGIERVSPKTRAHVRIAANRTAPQRQVVFARSSPCYNRGQAFVVSASRF